MHAAVIAAALAAAVLVLIVVHRMWRARSDERLQWQATRQQEWTPDELVALRVPDLHREPATAA